MATALTLALVVTVTAGVPLSPEARHGRAVMQRAQCSRCHDVTDASGRGLGISPAPRPVHCVGCHEWVLSTRNDETARAKERRTYPYWDRYLENIVHFTSLPDLGTLARRADPEFLRRYLDAPFDLRPLLDESMLTPRLSARDKDDLVAYMSELNDGAVSHCQPITPVTGERLAQGRELFSDNCASCHVLGTLPLGDPELREKMRAVAQHAPNLRFVRERMSRATLVDYLVDPQAVDPKSRMPKQRLTVDSAELLADFVLNTDLGAEPAPRLAARPEVAVLTRSVSFEEVQSTILSRICVHCHMSPARNNGLGGPGHSGGLTYAGVKLDLETWAGVQRGIMRNGRRVSILTPPRDGGAPLLLEALLHRYDETAADPRNPPRAHTATGRPGMPMALPPLSVAQLSLIKTWLVNGAPGPLGSP